MIFKPLSRDLKCVVVFEKQLVKDNRLLQTKENKFPVENWEGFKEPSGFFVNADYYF